MKPKSVEDLLTEDDIAIIAEEQATKKRIESAAKVLADLPERSEVEQARADAEYVKNSDALDAELKEWEATLADGLDDDAVGERVSAHAWRCPCGLEMSYAERPECTCGKSIRP